jgi:hypothetical protein
VRHILDPEGRVVDERAVGHDASGHGISLRTGCLCNPGAGEDAFAVSRRLLRGRRVGRMSGTLDDYLTRLGLPSGGAVRVSLGIASASQDLDVFLAFVEGHLPRPSGLGGRGPSLPPPPQLTRRRPGIGPRRAGDGASVRRFASRQFVDGSAFETRRVVRGCTVRAPRDGDGERGLRDGTTGRLAG